MSSFFSVKDFSGLFLLDCNFLNIHSKSRKNENGAFNHFSPGLYFIVLLTQSDISIGQLS